MAISVSQLTRMINYITNQQGLQSKAATALLLATAAHESHLGTYLYQIGGGPARGLFGMEISHDGIMGTEESIWSNYLKYRQNRRKTLSNICGVRSPHPYNNQALVYDLRYQICMARTYYWMVPEPLPNPYDAIGQMTYWAKYWKRVDVTTGDEADFLSDHRKYIGAKQV